MTDDRLDALRKNVARHGDKAQVRPLIELAEALMDRYWREGIGSPAARPYLDEAIRMLEKAYNYLEPGTFMRGQVACQLGNMVGTRYAVDFSSEQDRERGIRLLDEALTFPQLPRVMQLHSRSTLGTLLMSRLLRNMQSGDFAVRAMFSGLSSAETANADRAVACFRQVLDDPAANVEITTTAQTALSMIEAFKAMAGGGISGGAAGVVDRMEHVLRLTRAAQQQAASRQTGIGYGYIPNLFNSEADDIARKAPLERPVAVFHGTAPAAASSPPPRPEAPTPLQARTFRTALLARLPIPGYPGLLAALEDGAELPTVDAVDDLVALGSSLVEAPETVGTDQLLLAITLYLRAAVEKRSSGRNDGGAEDAEAAAESLLAAGDALLAEPRDTVVVAFHLATALDRLRKAVDARVRLAERFAAATEALRTVGADGLLYPASDTPLLLSTGTGRFGPAKPGSLPARLLVVGERQIPDPVVVSYVRSAAQVIDLATRTRRPLTEQAVFVANPRRDRRQATVDALVLRRSFYPGSEGLGETAENVDGAGSSDDLRRRLNASLLHLGCGITGDGGVELAGSDVLGAAEIAAGKPLGACGLAVLPPTTNGAPALVDALLASRFRGVIAFRNKVPDEVASLMYFLLHKHLVDDRLDPAPAVDAVRQWMADPQREPLDDLPGLYSGVAAASDLADPAHWGALIHCGV